MKTKSQSINQIILPYAGIMATLCLFAQVVTAFRGSQIDLVAGLALVPAYLYYLYFYFTTRHTLSKVRFGSLVAHFIAFLIVNLSYHIHATILALGAINAAKGGTVLPQGWFGVLFGMFVFWGCWLLVHTIASISHKGYEELDI